VEVPSVEDARIIDPQRGVAYLKLTSFQKTTSRDIDTALWKLHREGMRSLIIDVRGNPGGLLTASVDVADKFVTDGVLVSTRGRSAREDFDYKARRVGTWQVPLVVLIDRDTASASEIFAGAIRDHHRGEVVGERSYGKGSVQGIFPLEGHGAGIRLTTAKFYGPSGQAISKQGVTPSIAVQTTAKPDSTGQFVVDTPARDTVLIAGIDAAKRLAMPELSQR
jgi:carboxyl-terminal processing protease